MTKGLVRRVTGRGVRAVRAAFGPSVDGSVSDISEIGPGDPEASAGRHRVRSTAEIEALAANVKTLGYELARARRDSVLLTVDTSSEPRRHGVVSKATTQADVESPWFSYWCGELRCAPIYHRKLWEFAVVLQTLHEHDLLRHGVRGVGFGCGAEPLASYFAACGVDVLITDLDVADAAGKGWVDTGQHALSKEIAFQPEIVSREAFDRHVSHRIVDMNDIPDDLGEDHDFCWSVCAMEHLGSIEDGLAFVERSLSLLRPGGIAVHTTEYNYLPHGDTVRSGPTVLYQRADIEQLAERVQSHGGRLLGPDFGIGDGVFDRYVDVPPYLLDEGLYTTGAFDQVHQSAHLRLLLDGFPATCFCIIVEKCVEPG